MSFVLKLPSQLKKGAAEQEHAVKKEQGLVFDVVDPNAHLAWNRNKGGPVWGVKNAPSQGGGGQSAEAARASAKPKGWNVQPPSGAAFSIAESLAKVDGAHPHNPPKAPLAGRFGGGGLATAPAPHAVTAETYKEPVFEGAAWADEVEEEDELPSLDIPIPPGPAALTAAAVPKAKEPEPRPRPDAWGAKRIEGDEERGGGQQLPLGASPNNMEQRTRSDDLADRRGDNRGFDRGGFGDRRAFGPGAGHEDGGRFGGDGHLGLAEHGRDSHMHMERGGGSGYARGGNGERGLGDRGHGYDRGMPRHDHDGFAGLRGAGGVQSPGCMERGVTLLARPAVHANPSEHGAAALEPQRFRSTSLPEAPKDVPRAGVHEREMRAPEDRNPAHPDAHTPPRSPAMQPHEGRGRAEPADDMGGGCAALGKARTTAALEPAKPIMIMRRPDASASPSIEDRRRGAAEALAKVKAHVADQPPPPVHHEPRPRLEPEPHATHAPHPHPHGHAYLPNSNFTPQQLDAHRAEEKRRFKEEAIARLKAQAEAAQPPKPAALHATQPAAFSAEPKARLPEAPKAVVHPVQPQLLATPQIMRRPEPAPVPSDDSAASGKGKGPAGNGPRVNGNVAKAEEEGTAGDGAQGKGKKGKQSKDNGTKQQQQQQQQQQKQQQQHVAKTPREVKPPKGSKGQAQAKPDAAQAQAPPSGKKEQAQQQQQQAPKQAQGAKEDGEGASVQTPRGGKAQKGPKPSKENSDASSAPNGGVAAPPSDTSPKEAKVFKGNNAPRGQKNDGADGVKAPKARNDTADAALPQIEDSNNAARIEEGSQASKADRAARAPVQIYRPPVRGSKPDDGGKKGEAAPEGSAPTKVEGEGSSGRGGKGGGRGRGRGKGSGPKDGVAGAPKAEVPVAQ